MIFEDESRVRLTKSELNLLRQHNAQNGIALNEINTRDELLKAVIDGLPPELVEDMLEFMETGSSSTTRDDSK